MNVETLDRTLPDATSDYGEELVWDDEELETQLDLIEAGAVAPAPKTAEWKSKSKVDVQIAPTDAVHSPRGEGQSGREYKEALIEALEELNGANGSPDARSLWQRYRQKRGWGALSVTDLVGPSWCEVQHAYRLESKSHLPPSQRPTEIVTVSGATVSVDRVRTVAREKILDGGKVVHAKIEKQVMGDLEPVKVDVTGKEEWWSLRILNTLVCLESLIANGRTREIPVTGFIDDFLVFGVIDEVDRREIGTSVPSAALNLSGAQPSSSSPSPFKSKKLSTKDGKRAEAVNSDDSQRKLDAFFRKPATVVPTPLSAEEPSSPERKSAPSTSASRWGLILSDTKTRKSPTLPYESESRASRLQLMLYHRLLTALLLPQSRSASVISLSSSRPKVAPFDWTKLYTHLRLDPDSPLSDSFISSIEPILAGLSIREAFSPKTLSQVTAGLSIYGSLMGATSEKGPLEDELEISYVMREKTRKRKRGRNYESKKREEENLNKAIEESLKAARGGMIVEEITPADEEEELSRAIAASLAKTEDPADQSSGIDPEDVPENSQPNELPQIPDSSLLTGSLNVSPPPSDKLASHGMQVDHDLLVKSQSHDAASSPVLEVEAGPRYNLRRRRDLSGGVTTEVVDVTDHPTDATTSSTVHLVAPSTSSRRAVDSDVLASDEDDKEIDVEEGALIGTHRFKNNAKELDAWLLDVIGYWHGSRAPKGVALEQTNRCR